MRPLTSSRPREPDSTEDAHTDSRRSSILEVTLSRPGVGALLEAGPDAVFALDGEWRIVYANRRVSRLHAANYDGERCESGLIGRTLAETMPALWQRTETALRFAAAEGAGFSLEEYFADLEAWLEIRACPLPGGLCIWIRDVNERFQRQASVFEGDVRLRSLVDSGRKQAERALRRQTKLTALLHAVTTVANDARSVEDALSSALQCVCDFLEWPVATAWLGSPSGDVHSSGITYSSLASGSALVVDGAGMPPLSRLDLPAEELATGRAFLVSELAARADRPRHAAAAQSGFTVALYCPIQAAGRTVSLLEFFSDNEAGVDSTAIAAVDNVAAQLGRVFERHDAHEERLRHLDHERLARAEAEHRALEEGALRKATAAVAAARTQDDVIVEIARSAVTALCAQGAYVERIQAGSPDVIVAATAGSRVPRLSSRRPYAGSLSETVLGSGVPELVPDLEATAGLQLAELNDGCRGCSGLVVPLAEGRAAIGALILVRGPDLPCFSSDEIERARIFSELAALAFAKVALLEESEAKRRQLERVMQSRERLIRGFSHDVKNPLGGADGYAQMLENGMRGMLSQPQRETVGRIRMLIGSAHGLIQDLLDLARAEAVPFELERVRVDVARLAADVADEFRASANALGIDIRTRGAPDVVTRSDPQRIRQILQNLLSNALKYAGQTSIDIHIAVRVGRRTGDPLRWVAVDVIDSGPGIARDQLDYIFREFTRVAPERAQGAGVGLAISRRLARLLGGDLTVESEPGKGSTFTLWLPLTTH